MPVPLLPELPELPGSLDARFPVLLLPVSVQVKFVRTPAIGEQPTRHELRVRIYPDQLGISTHEGELTTAEELAGQQYWSGAGGLPGRGSTASTAGARWWRGSGGLAPSGLCSKQPPQTLRRGAPA